MTRLGVRRAISSGLGRRNVPTFGSLFTSRGNLQYVETPTTWFPSPSANSVSVMLGEVETMRAGAGKACRVLAYVVSAFRRTRVPTATVRLKPDTTSEAPASRQTTVATHKHTKAAHQRFIR